MKILVKDSNDNVMELDSVNGSIPEGLTAVPQEDSDAAELSLSKKNKLGEIRSKRDSMLSKNDTVWMISKKKNESTTAIEADAEILRDLPELAETELDELTDVEDIKAYDCFSGLALSRSYE